MRRIKQVIDELHTQIFDLEDAVTLLVREREENFEGERAIRLFQFHTWIMFPDSPLYSTWAGFLAAAKYLTRIEEEHFTDEESARFAREDRESTLVNLRDMPPQTVNRILALRSANKAYRQIYDRFIARPGGLLALLNTPTPTQFDVAVNYRIDHLYIVADLVDYRLRYLQHPEQIKNVIGDGANHNHALWFCWFPTRSIPSKRGKTPQTRPSPRGRCAIGGG
jgi:hypothetical protein